jgi:hypothetical protein
VENYRGWHAGLSPSACSESLRPARQDTSAARQPIQWRLPLGVDRVHDIRNPACSSQPRHREEIPADHFRPPGTSRVSNARSKPCRNGKRSQLTKSSTKGVRFGTYRRQTRTNVSNLVGSPNLGGTKVRQR